MTQVSFNRLLFLIAMVGIFISSMLILKDWHILDIPCTSSGCDRIADWKPSKIISIIGFLYYIFIGLIVWKRSIQPFEQWNKIGLMLFALTLFGTIFNWSLYFYGQEALNAVCQWCRASAITVTLLLLASAFQLSRRDNSPEETILPNESINAPGSIEAYKQDKKLFITLAIICILSSVGYALYTDYNLKQVSELEAKKIDYILPKDLAFHAKGSANAPVTVIEFSDLMCPMCHRVQPAIEDFIANNPQNVRYIYRHFPLQNHGRPIPGHELNLTAAYSTELAAAQGEDKFWKMYFLIMREHDPRIITRETLSAYAKMAGLDPIKFKTELDGVSNASALSKVTRDMEDGAKCNIVGTPTFYIVTADKHILQATSVDALLKALSDPHIKPFINKMIDRTKILPAPSPEITPSE